MKSQKFYQSLGKLFYAIASVDKVVRKDEVEILKSLVKEKWLDLDDVEDEFGTDAAYQIEIVFDWLLDQDVKSETAYFQFKEFYNQQSELFSTKVKQLIWETSESIAAAFSGKNKAEENLLMDLKSLLQ
jgi:hypothetical protein